MAKRVTLTFDNGPTPGVTDRILDLLKERNIKTTFFVVGQQLSDPARRALTERARAEGHWVGNHSLTHSVPLGEKVDPEYARAEIGTPQMLLGELLEPNKFFRPFGGGGHVGDLLFSPAAFELLQQEGYTIVLWTSVPGDWRDQEHWVENCVADVTVQEWPVVVIHDLDNASLPRLPELLDRLTAMGVEFTQQFPESVIPMRGGELQWPIDHLIKQAA
ncbi:polysaccharide deacetylase family protein [Paraburkholderia sediminicola]|uniref:polysaccharide deacetylase family protein n=1 Tax=Paraburkholderia sediminicola TaxID=458836 RepID=UPI0038BD9E6A